MVEIFLTSIFAFFGIWFFGLRSILKKRGISNNGADFFQAFIKDILLGVNLVKKGDQIVTIIVSSMFICVLVAAMSLIIM